MDTADSYAGTGRSRPTGPASSTQDDLERESTDTDRPADDGTVYQSATYDSAVDELDVHEPVAGTDNERGADERITEHPVGEGNGARPDTVDGSVPAGHADPDHLEPEHAVGVASVPDAEPAEPEVVEEHDGVAAVTDPGQPVNVDARAEVASGETPIVPVPMDDAASPDVTRSGEMLPGDLTEAPSLALFDGDTAGRFRERWHELQLRFVDDPRAAESQAVALVDEVVTALRDTIDRQRSALHDWQSGQDADAHSGDTEQMRVTVRRYRDFLDHLLGV